jgi:hypothetical protein
LRGFSSCELRPQFSAHFTEQWIFSKDGKDDEHDVFKFMRKK